MMPGPSEITPILGTQESQGSDHFPQQEFNGHGNRLSNKRRSTRRSADTVTNDNESITDWDESAEEGDSDFSALMNLVTGAIGSGVVYLPAAAGECGLALGLILICICGFVSAHSTTIIGMVLLMARNLGKKNGFEKVVETFEDVSEVCWGAIGFWIISFINYLDLYLTVAVFMGTLAATCNDAILAVMNTGKSDGDEENAEYWWFVVAVFGWGAAVLPLCLLKSMDAIAKMSLLGVAANFIILFCVIYSAFEDRTEFNNGITLCYERANNDIINTDAGVRQHVNDLYGEGMNPTELAAAGKTPGVAYDYFQLNRMWGAYGNFGFSFAVAVCVPSILVGMKNPRHLGKVVWGSHFIITGVYAIIIFVSWMAWGNGVMGCPYNPSKPAGARLGFSQANVITSTFMPSLWVQLTAATCLMISIMSSVPLFFFSIAVLVEGLAKERFPNIHEFTLRIVNRTFMLILCLLPPIALNTGYPDDDTLTNFQGFTGAVTTTTICTILPNLLYLVMSQKFPKGHIFSPKIGFSILCACCLAFGIFSAVVGFLADGLQLFKLPSPFGY
jgi:amino acid permease